MMKAYYYLVIFILTISCSNRNEEYRQRAINDEFKGVITKIYRDSKNHNVYIFELNTLENGSMHIVADFYSKSWTFASLNDSIIKNRGNTYITIKKKSGISQKFETRFK